MSNSLDKTSESIVKAYGNSFTGMNTNRLTQAGNGSDLNKAGKYAALALAFKGSTGMVELTGNPEAPFCYMVNASSPTFGPLNASGFISKPDFKPQLLICSDTEGTAITLSAFAGFPMYLETTTGISYFSGGAYVNECQLAGYRYEVGGPLVNIPPNVPIRTMYGYNSKDNKIDFRTPSDTIKSLDPIGTRGELCVDCIRKGHSESKDDTGKPITCSPTGYLYVVVTHIVGIKKVSTVVGGKTVEVTNINPKQGFKPISSFYDEDGNPLDNLVLCIKLARGSLSGHYVKDNPELCINGPIQYMALLKTLFTDPSMQDASRHLTLFTTKASTDKEGKPSKFTQLHLTHVLNQHKDSLKDFGLESFDNDAEYQKARSLWEQVRPNIDVQVIPEPVTEEVEVVGYNTSNLKSAAPSQEIDNEEWSDFNDFNFGS